MKIAVASNDGTNISHHFGRSECFIVFEVENGQVKSREVKQNTFTAHALGECNGEHAHHEEHHSHAGIVAALQECDAVLCYGMGFRAAQDLQANGIKAYILESEYTPEEAVSAFIRGDVKKSGGFCHCHE